MSMRWALVTASLVAVVLQAAAAEVSVPDSVRKYRFLAKTARDKSDFEAAAQYYAEYLLYEPQDVAAYYRLGQMHLKLKNTVAAKGAFQQAVARDSSHINSNILLYGIYMSEEAADSAAVCLERVLAVKPDDLEKRRTLADLYRREGRIEAAIAHYEQLAEQVAEPQQVGELLALLYEDLGNTEAALQWRRQLLGEANGDLAARLDGLETMVRLQLETGDMASAVRTLEELARVDTVNRYSYYSRIAKLADEKNDGALRLRAWEGMVTADPRDLETVARLAEHYLSHDKLPRAGQWIERGLQVDAGDAHLQLLRGDLLLALGDDEEAALEAFELARASPRWEAVAQQRIWQLRPPETEEEKLRKAFFGTQTEEGN